MDGYLLYGNNIQQLMEELQLELTSGQCRLSIDSSSQFEGSVTPQRQ